MNYIYRSNGHLFLVALSTEGEEKDPNEMTHLERVASYIAEPLILGHDEAVMAFYPPWMHSEGLFNENDSFNEGIYILNKDKLFMTLNDEMCLIQEIPAIFHNVSSSEYRVAMEMYIKPFEFINQLDNKTLRSHKAAALIADRFLKLMDGFADFSFCYYIHERSNKVGAVEKPLSFIPRKRGVVANDPIIIH